jgi:hypothetical protein
MADKQSIGPWEVSPGQGHNARPFWQLTRRNPEWRFGREYLLTASKRDARRFYVRAKADAAAVTLNATDGVKVPAP